jgi:nucleoside-diphosphate-sugar epimerase
MKIFIAGGGGYIGSALLVSFPKDWEIVCLDHGRYFNSLRSIVGPNVKLIKGDILNRELISRNMKNADIVLHMAGGGGNDICMKDPARSVMVNIQGTHLLLKAAEENSVDRFIFTSSYIAYSTFLKRPMPLTEDMELKPDEFYGALKAASEREIMDSGMDYVILRLSNVYGYGCGLGHEWSGVIGRFIKSAYENATIPVYGSGKQKIDVVHISDACKAISMISNNKSISGHFNVGGGKATSVEAMSKMVAYAFKNKFNKNIKIMKKEAPPGKVWPDRWMSIAKIGRQIGWEPETKLEDGIADLVAKYGR